MWQAESDNTLIRKTRHMDFVLANEIMLTPSMPTAGRFIHGNRDASRYTGDSEIYDFQNSNVNF